MFRFLLLFWWLPCACVFGQWDTLRVLTFNIHHGEGTDGKLDMERVASVIGRLEPDLVALQEVDRGATRSGRVDQLEFLAGALGWQATFGEAMPFQGGAYGNGILSRFPLHEIDSRSLPFRPGQEPRNVVVATVRPNNGLPPFRFASTHWAHDRGDVREEQAEQLAAWLSESREKRPVILAGDFNARDFQPPMTVMRQAGWRLHSGEKRMIDHVLTRESDPWEVVAEEVIEDRVTSDHRPLLVTLRWTGRRSPRTQADGVPGTLFVWGSEEVAALPETRQVFAEQLGASVGGRWFDRGVDFEGVQAAQRWLERGGVVAGPPRLLACVPGLRFELAPQGLLHIQGRRAWGRGEGEVKVRLPASATQPAEERTLEGERPVDLTALRRAALDRQGPPFPAKKVRSPVVPEGTLFLVGGGRVPGEILDRFFAAAGGERARLAIIPISSPAPLRRPLWLEEEAERRGVEAVNVLQPRTPEGVDDPEVLRFLDTATAVWFGGGRQWRFVDAYEDTRALERLHAVLKRGGVIGGSSAGASIQAEYMARGNPLGSRQIMAEGYERGLDFLPGAAVDQHFRQRNRFPDMEALMRTHSQLLGIGIDEATALVVREHHAEVLGEGEAHFYDWRQAEGAPEALGRGEVYDLVKRSVAVRPQ